MSELRMMFRLLGASVKAQVMYRADFIVGVLGTLFYNLTFLATIGVISVRFGGLGGFSGWEILFMFSFFELSHSLFGYFLNNISNYLGRHVIDGTLDLFFLRPYSVLTQLSGLKMNYTSFADTVIGLAGLIVAFSQLQPAWDITKTLLMILFIVCGVFIEFALALSMNCASIVFPNGRGLFFTYYQFVIIAQRYPLNIFATGFQGILTFIFPLGFINYYPMLRLLDKPGGWIAYFTPLVALVFMTIAMSIYRVTLKRYASTGN